MTSRSSTAAPILRHINQALVLFAMAVAIPLLYVLSTGPVQRYYSTGTKLRLIWVDNYCQPAYTAAKCTGTQELLFWYCGRWSRHEPQNRW